MTFDKRDTQSLQLFGLSPGTGMTLADCEPGPLRIPEPFATGTSEQGFQDVTAFWENPEELPAGCRLVKAGAVAGFTL